jgi:amino acid permease
MHAADLLVVVSTYILGVAFQVFLRELVLEFVDHVLHMRE